MPRILVLDVDGVIVHGHPEGGRWDRHLERDLGLAPALLQERFFKPHWQRIAIGQADTLAVLQSVWPSLRTAATPHQLLDYWLAADSAIDAAVIAAVDAWTGQGNLAFLATVQEHRRAAHLMNALGLARHFSAMFYSADLGAAKPDRTFFERAQARLPAGDVIFLDDRPDNVEAAATVGWRAHRYRSIEDLRAALT
jgi:putative hydrolase of the HAD superfamily